MLELNFFFVVGEYGDVVFLDVDFLFMIELGRILVWEGKIWNYLVVIGN